MKIELPIDFSSGTNFRIKKNSIWFELKKEATIVSHNFYFIIREIGDYREINITVTNAGNSMFEKGWYEYKPFMSEDGVNYSRINNSKYLNGEYSFKVETKSLNLWIACFPPYSEKRLLDFLNPINFHVFKLKKSGLEYYILNKINTTETIVFLNRQHPGEFQGSYFLEGIIKYSASNNVLFNLIIFPLINKDGAEISNHRYNSSGQDLNRKWGTTTSPLNEIEQLIINQKNLKYIFDLHGDEVSKIDYIFSSSKTTLEEKIDYFTFLQFPSKLKRLIKHIIKNKNIKFSFGGLASEYLEKITRVPCFTIELSSHKNSEIDCVELGSRFIKDLNTDLNPKNSKV